MLLYYLLLCKKPYWNTILFIFRL